MAATWVRASCAACQKEREREAEMLGGPSPNGLLEMALMCTNSYCVLGRGDAVTIQVPYQNVQFSISH